MTNCLRTLTIDVISVDRQDTIRVSANHDLCQVDHNKGTRTSEGGCFGEIGPN